MNTTKTISERFEDVRSTLAHMRMPIQDRVILLDRLNAAVWAHLVEDYRTELLRLEDQLGLKQFYVCERYSLVWSGKVSEMRPDYEYPLNSTYYFDTLEEAEEAARYLNNKGN